MEQNLRSEKEGRFWEITCFKPCHKKYTNCQLQSGPSAAAYCFRTGGKREKLLGRPSGISWA